VVAVLGVAGEEDGGYRHNHVGTLRSRLGAAGRTGLVARRGVVDVGGLEFRRLALMREYPNVTLTSGISLRGILAVEQTSTNAEWWSQKVRSFPSKRRLPMYRVIPVSWAVTKQLIQV